MDKALDIKMKMLRFKYLTDDYNIKKDVVKQVDADFSLNIKETIYNDETLNKIFNISADELESNINQSTDISTIINEPLITETINNGENVNDDVNDNVNDNVVINDDINNTKDTELKKCYRKIVKLTHPDKVVDVRLNSLYLDAVKHYDDNNKFGIYLICDDLQITYDTDNIDIKELSEFIYNLQNNISSIESSYTWQWYSSSDNEFKERLILSYIDMLLKNKTT